MFWTAVAASRPISETSSSSSSLKASGSLRANETSPIDVRADEERRRQAGAQPELEQLRLLGIEVVAHVAAVNGLLGREHLEDRAR